MNSNVLGQIKGTIIPLADPDLPFFNLMGASHFNNLVILVGTVTGLLYFFFSKDHKGNFGRVTRVGIYFLMISFGASFGFNVMGRISLLIGRFTSLIEYNDHSYSYGTSWMLLLIVIIIGLWYFLSGKSSNQNV